MTPRLLTEPEVAEILRCSCQKVKRLRLSGDLPYIPGRPNLILEEDLADYISRARTTSMEVSERAIEDRNDAAQRLKDAREWVVKSALVGKRGKAK